MVRALLAAGNYNGIEGATRLETQNHLNTNILSNDQQVIKGQYITRDNERRLYKKNKTRLELRRLY